jgi:hypothetical protein
MIYLFLYFVIGFILSLTLLNLRGTNYKQKLGALVTIFWVSLFWFPLMLLLGYLELRRIFM